MPSFKISSLFELLPPDFQGRPEGWDAEEVRQACLDMYDPAYVWVEKDDWQEDDNSDDDICFSKEWLSVLQARIGKPLDLGLSVPKPVTEGPLDVELSGPQPLTVNPLDLELKSRESSILVSDCAYCPKQSGELYDCVHCRAVTYCCEAHLLLDQHPHREVCDLIKASRARAEVLRLELLAEIDNPFRTRLGHFWLFPKTKAYLEELSTLVELHEPIKHRTAVERQLVFAFHIMYMGGTDGSGFRFKVPALLIRINRDQECYDFMKWRNRLKMECLTQTSLDYMRSRFANPMIINPRVPIIPDDPQEELVGYRRENIFENLRFFDDETPIMTLIPLCLVKIRLMFEVQRLQLAYCALGEKFPNELLNIILKQIPYTKSIASRDKLIRSEEARHTAINTLMGHVLQLYRRVRGSNSLVWKGIVWWMRDVDTWAPKDEAMDWKVWNMKNFVKLNWKSWVETPGAISLLQRIMVEEGNL